MGNAQQKGERRVLERSKYFCHCLASGLVKPLSEALNKQGDALRMFLETTQ